MINFLTVLVFKNFPRADTLNRHLKSNNCVNNWSYFCNMCSKGFVTDAQLETHKKKNCPKKYYCNSCNTYFSKNIDLVNHKESHHSEK